MELLVVLLCVLAIVIPAIMLVVVIVEMSSMQKIISEFSKLVDKNTKAIEELQAKLKGILYK